MCMLLLATYHSGSCNLWACTSCLSLRLHHTLRPCLIFGHAFGRLATRLTNWKTVKCVGFKWNVEHWAIWVFMIWLAKKPWNLPDSVLLLIYIIFKSALFIASYNQVPILVQIPDAWQTNHQQPTSPTQINISDRLLLWFTFNISWLIKLTGGVCRGLPCCAASPEKLFSFFWKDNHGSPWLM